ncbi:MAG: transcriptional regulator [Gammaproteobacteria bacterium]|nr:transcriptional regulator [Gammaproteobacteria bacterium]
MDSLAPLELDATLHQPVRTRIVAFLVTRGEATFTELKNELEITDGNLESHIKKLLAEKYMKKQKKTGPTKRSQTIYTLTKKGTDAFENYLETLKQVLTISF